MTTLSPIVAEDDRQHHLRAGRATDHATGLASGPAPDGAGVPDGPGGPPAATPPPAADSADPAAPDDPDDPVAPSRTATAVEEEGTGSGVAGWDMTGWGEHPDLCGFWVVLADGDLVDVAQTREEAEEYADTVSLILRSTGVSRCIEVVPGCEVPPWAVIVLCGDTPGEWPLPTGCSTGSRARG